MKRKNLLILGLGISGKSAAMAMAKKEVNVFVYDDNIKSIPDELKNLNIEFIVNSSDVMSKEFDLIMKSPGIKPDNPVVRELSKKNIEIISDIELAFRFKKNQKIIAITGTNGKTTTTSLINEILLSCGKKSKVVGNIGVGAVEEFTNEENDYLVLECSSFQLDNIKEFKAEISVITNITTDHLDYHKTVDNYINAKLNLLSNLDENNYVVLNNDDTILKKIDGNFKIVLISGEETLDNGFYYDNGYIYEVENKNIISSLDTSKIIIKGLHNYYNIMCALSVAKILKLDKKKVYDAIYNFPGVKHRLQFVKKINGVSYYNDSKGTNADSTIKAISSFNDPIVLILGGYNKNEDFRYLLDFGKSKIKSIIALGDTKEYIFDLANSKGFDKVYKVNNLTEAIDLSQKITEDGDVLLFSPACASWDMYKNFEERGDEFISLVEKIDGI